MDKNIRRTIRSFSWVNPPLIPLAQDAITPPAEQLPTPHYVHVMGRKEHEELIKSARKCQEMGLDWYYEVNAYLKRYGGYMSGEHASECECSSEKTDSLNCDKCGERMKYCDCCTSTIDRPPYYQGGKFQAIDVIEDFNLNFCLGNAIKYILRAGKKEDKIEDLKKAVWYLEREIDNGE